MEKIVVWQTAFLGDLVLTSNLLLNIHKNFPDKEIFLVARPFAEELFFDLPWLRIIPFNKTLKENWEIIKKTKRVRFGYFSPSGFENLFIPFFGKNKREGRLRQGGIFFSIHQKSKT
jgi:heptosyltransferase-2